MSQTVSVEKKRPSPKPAPPKPSQAEEKEPETAPAEDDISVGQAFRRLFRGLRPTIGIRVIGLIVLIAALVAVAGYFGWQNFSKAATTNSQADALASARVYATDLTTYDYRALSGNFKKVTANSTGEFAVNYGKVSQGLTKLIQQYHATSKGTVVRAGIFEGTNNRVVVILFVDQQITNTNSKQPRIDRNRMQMILLKTNGRWMISDVALL
jgi:Mce-associated membrane protein